MFQYFVFLMEKNFFLINSDSFPLAVLTVTSYAVTAHANEDTTFSFSLTLSLGNGRR